MTFVSASPWWAPILAYLQLAAPYMAIAALVLALAAVVLVALLRRRLGRLALGRNGNIEESISILTRETNDLKDFRAELERYLTAVESRVRGSVRGVGLVRFNPFEQGQGGNQSFAVAFLDERGHGAVLSTLYARDRVGVYAKPVEAGVSSFDLTPEEKEAIAVAQKHAADYKKRA
mgnify:CR=1 FL=1